MTALAVILVALALPPTLLAAAILYSVHHDTNTVANDVEDAWRDYMVDILAERDDALRRAELAERLLEVVTL